MRQISYPTTRLRFLGVAPWALLVAILVLVLQAADAQDQNTLRITNNSRYDIFRVYMTSSTVETWGRDLLRDSILKTGQYFEIRAMPGVYDLKFVDEDGDECKLHNIRISRNTSWTLTTEWLLKCQGFRTSSATARRYYLKITNNSDYDIYQLNVSSSNSDAWGRDLLGDRILRSGGEFTITGLAPGTYDVRFVDKDGDKCILKSQVVYKDMAWSISTAWLLKCEGFLR